MSDEKTLLPELLPVPQPVIPSVGPRERVAKHWHTLMTAGAATAALAGCGCLVMDPLPPPAQCRTTRSVLSVADFEAEPTSTGLTLTASWPEYEDVGLAFLSIEGGRLDGQPTAPSRQATVISITDTGAGPVTVIFTTTCEGTAATSIKVVLTPQGADGGADAGPARWLVSASDL